MYKTKVNIGAEHSIFFNKEESVTYATFQGLLTVQLCLFYLFML
jgi:hypothetical protein